MMEVLPIGLLIATDRSARRIVGNRVAREFLRIPEADGNLSLSAPPGEAPSQFRVFQDGVELAPDDLPVHRAARAGARKSGADGKSVDMGAGWQPGEKLAG